MGYQVAFESGNVFAQLTVSG